MLYEFRLPDIGEGVVEVKVTEGPMSFAKHAVGFTAWGTKKASCVRRIRYSRSQPAREKISRLFAYAFQSCSRLGSTRRTL